MWGGYVYCCSVSDVVRVCVLEKPPHTTLLLTTVCQLLTDSTGQNVGRERERERK